MQLIRRLVSYIRYLREPTFNDPKAQRWADLFQKRARFTGQLPQPDTLEQLGIPADDAFWKQDNANPASGFAVNILFPVASALTIDSPSDLELNAFDDFGRAVRQLPLSRTSDQFYFNISNSVFSLDSTERTIPVSEVVWNVATVLRELLATLETEPAFGTYEDEDEDEDENDENSERVIDTDPSHHTIRRITWDKSLNAWYVMTI